MFLVRSGKMEQNSRSQASEEGDGGKQGICTVQKKGRGFLKFFLRVIPHNKWNYPLTLFCDNQVDCQSKLLCSVAIMRSLFGVSISILPLSAKVCYCYNTVEILLSFGDCFHENV